jgi:ABC-type methionine transport system ATPase subunit
MIRLVNIARDFSTQAGVVRVLHGINLEIPAGQIFGIIGASGAGKSTLVRTINLLERLSEGDERITDARGEGLRRLRRIGMVFQHFNLLNSRTVAGNSPIQSNWSDTSTVGKSTKRSPRFSPVSGCRNMQANTPRSFPAAKGSASVLP